MKFDIYDKNNEVIDFKVVTITYYHDDNETLIRGKRQFNSNGQLHRENKPAEIWYYESGEIEYKIYWLNDIKHRVDGPAYISYHQMNHNIEHVEYYINGKRHRLDGPASIWYDIHNNIQSEEYFIQDTKYSKEEFEKECKRLKNIELNLNLLNKE